MLGIIKRNPTKKNDDLGQAGTGISGTVEKPKRETETGQQYGGG
jgi:hypothetical protein